jgi:hypothetical protein
MNESVRLPDMNDIASWRNERCQVERTRLRNELSFIQGERAHGGPPREDLATALKFRIAAIEQRLERICAEAKAARISTRASAEKAHRCNTPSDFHHRAVTGLEPARGQ